MWLKTLLGFFVSLSLSLSLMLNTAYLLPLPREVYLLLGFVGGIVLWGVIMTMFYCASGVGRLMWYCGTLLVISLAINGAFMLGVFA
ncbi:hypothetical protein [uncultured Methylophaga sp.]|uniref:hypothetical protein n=1 Tax=uncultured Methylophaga sp. TaxID=285271 RepID=UPI00261BEF80|nr:hypothetical protein [uncultured Methylophaga sp.]